jgi:hypothetical protein
MEDYTINVVQVEEYQTLENTNELENIFTKARSAIVNGAKVILVRKGSSGKAERFDEMDTLEDLEQYKAGVFKYIK